MNRQASVKGIQEVVRHYVTLDTGAYKGAANTDTIQFRAIGLVADFGLGMCKTVESEIVSIPFVDRPAQITLEIPVPADKQAIVMVEVLNYADDYRYCALDVVAVVPPFSTAVAGPDYYVAPAAALPAERGGFDAAVWPAGRE